MKNLLRAFTIVAAAAVTTADTFTMTFKGLDLNYAFRPMSISTLRAAIACRAQIQHSSVIIESATYKNTTWYFGETHEVNLMPEINPWMCNVINSVHWDSTREPNATRLLRELSDSDPINFYITIPVSASKATGTNVLTYLVTSVDEYYGDILASDFMSFVKGYISEQYDKKIHDKKMTDNIYNLMAIIIIGELIVVVFGNWIMNKIRYPTTKMQYQDRIQVIIK
jgi:hypothetical protein